MRHLPNLPIVRYKYPTATQLLPQLQQILNSGQVTNNGPLVQQFEKALTALLGVPTIVFSSGMAALIAMLRAVDVAGGEVICPSFTFAATPHAIVMAGAKPYFVDVDPDTLTLDNNDLHRLQGHLFKAILAVDPYGICWRRPPDLNPVFPVLIDSAPAFGSEIDDSFITPRCLAQIFSFHATKPFSTMEGGALCSIDPELMVRAKAIRNFGQEADGDCRYIGFNGKMMEICAAVGLKQLEDWQHRAPRRVESAIHLGAELRRLPGLRVPCGPPGQSPIWTYRPVFVEPEFGVARDDVVAALHGCGIDARLYYRACHQLSCYDDGTRLPVTERLAAQVIALPVYDSMTEGEIGHIAATFKEIQGCRS